MESQKTAQLRNCSGQHGTKVGWIKLIQGKCYQPKLFYSFAQFY